MSWQCGLCGIVMDRVDGSSYIEKRHDETLEARREKIWR